jgi:hypothetical protein
LQPVIPRELIGIFVDGVIMEIAREQSHYERAAMLPARAITLIENAETSL